MALGGHPLTVPTAEDSCEWLSGETHTVGTVAHLYGGVRSAKGFLLWMMAVKDTAGMLQNDILSP